MPSNNVEINIATKVDDTSLKNLHTSLEEVEKKAGNIRPAVDGANTALNKMGETGSSAASNVAKNLEAIGKSATNNAKNILSSSSVFSTLQSTADSAINSIVSGFQSADNAINNTFKGIQGAAAGAFNSLKGAADTAVSGIVKGFQSAGKSISDFSSGLSSVEKGIMGIIGAVGTASIGDLVFGNSMKAETNKVLIKGMTATGAEAKNLFNTVDQATNKSLVSMQATIPALNRIQKATGATGSTMQKVTEDVTNFGSYVYAMTGSAVLAEQAMGDLSKGIDGAYASLDQYSITEQTLKDTGLWSGKEEDVEGYMAAVTAAIGDTSELMDTTQGKLATLSKKFSVAGKQLGNDMLPYVNQLVDGFLNLDSASDGWVSKFMVGAGGVVTGFLTILPFISDGVVAYNGLKKAVEGSTIANISNTLSQKANTIAQNANNIAAELGNKIFEWKNGVTKTAIRQAQAHTNTIYNQTLSENGLISVIKQSSIYQSINNQIEKQRNNIKKKSIQTSISKSIATLAESVKLKLLNGETSVAALYERNYAIAKQRSLIASIRNAIAKASETVKTGVLTAYTITSTAAERTYAFVKNTVTLANIKSTAAKVAETAKTAVMTAYTTVATTAERAYNFVKQLQIGLFLRTAAAKGLEYTRNVLLAVTTGVMTVAERAYNAIKSFSLITTLKDVAAKGALALANTKTAISAGIMTAAQIGLNAVMMAAPYAIIVVALIAMVAAFKHLYATFPDFKNGIDQITSGLKELFGALMSGDLDTVGEKLKGAWDVLPEWLGNIDQQIQPAIQSMIDAFSGWASKVDWIGELQNAIGGLTSWIYGAALNLANWLVEGLKNFSTGLTEWLDGGGEGGQEVGQSIYDGIVSWWNANSPMLMELFNTVFMTLIPLMGEIGWKIIQALGLALWQGLVWVGQQIAVAWENNVSKPFWDWLNGIPGWIYNGLMGILVSVVTWAIMFALEANKAGNDFLNNILLYITSLPGRIWVLLLFVISKVSAWGTSLIAKGRSIATNTVNGIVNFFKTLPGKIYNAIKGVADKVKSVFSSAGTAAWNSFVSALDSVSGGLASIAIKAVSGGSGGSPFEETYYNGGSAGSPFEEAEAKGESWYQTHTENNNTFVFNSYVTERDFINELKHLLNKDSDLDAMRS